MHLFCFVSECSSCSNEKWIGTGDRMMWRRRRGVVGGKMAGKQEPDCDKSRRKRWLGNVRLLENPLDFLSNFRWTIRNKNRVSLNAFNDGHAFAKMCLKVFFLCSTQAISSIHNARTHTHTYGLVAFIFGGSLVQKFHMMAHFLAYEFDVVVLLPHTFTHLYNDNLPTQHTHPQHTYFSYL